MMRNILSRKSPGDLIFDVTNTVVMLALMFVTLYPMYYVLVASVTNNLDLLATPGFLWYPKGFTVGSFKLAFTHPLIVSGYKNILFIMAAGLFINILLTLFTGFFLASKNVYFRKPVLFMILFTMFFNGGMIPNYLNIRSLGLYDTLWALILPGAVSVYNSIICRTAIEAIPESLSESARIDGANDLTILFRIIAPLVKPTMVVLLLYYGIGHWNSWFSASIYIRDNYKLPIQNVLRAILIANSDILNSAATENDQINQFAETIKYAAIVITTVPVLFIYPFLQRYFVKGVMIGAVKG
ncbi:MAG: carbohydrate ABC transporter permease [Treponema sp.]|jgi:putative aldouronate transport system permease protein|nr:carbohydrate ABC transporter permease [Treponema sp.]